MSKAILLFYLFAAIGASAAQDAIQFRNGDLLYGTLKDVSSDGSIQCQLADAASSTDFKPGTLSEIDFSASTNGMRRESNSCRVLLTNGDTVAGSFISCDRSSAVLDTWYAGRLSLPRSAIHSLTFVPDDPAVFSGITGLDGWTLGESSTAFPTESGKWIYRNGAFYASKAASIARDVKLPDSAQIQFDLAWKGSLNLALALYTDSLQPLLLTTKDAAPDFGGFYSLRFMSSVFIDLWPIRKKDRFRSLGQLFYPPLSSRTRLHVDLRVSKPQHKFALFLDDSFVKEWIDPEGFVGEGTALRFVQNPGSAIKLSNLRITHWNGVFPEDTNVVNDTMAQSSDAFWLNDEVRHPADVESMINGTMLARTTNHEKLEISLSKLKVVEFPHEVSTSSEHFSFTVRGTFAEGGVLTFTLESWRPDEMMISSPQFGRAKFNPTVFSRLQFLYPEKKPDAPPKS